MKISRILACSLVLLLLSNAVLAEEKSESCPAQKNLPPQTYELIVDNYFSPYTGAALTMSAFNGYKLLDDRYNPSSEGKCSFWWGTGRFAKVLLLDLPVSTFLMITQHELFGHGYRLREFHVQGRSYDVGIFSGYAAFSQASFNKLTFPQKAAVDSGGMEATTILAAQQRQSWIMDGKLDHRDAVSYFFNSTDQYFYVHGTREDDRNDSNDVQAYMNEVNNWYGKQTLTMRKMRNWTTWDLLDPALWYSFLGIGTYIYDGSPTIPFYMFDINGYKYLPNTRSILAPYGMEVQLQNHIKTPTNQLIDINIRYGNNRPKTSYGLDVIIKPIWSYDKFDFGNRIFLWRQPQLSAATVETAGDRYGIAEYVNCAYNVNRNFALISEVGYKTPGYIQGEPLNSSVIVRLGFRYKAFNR